MASGQVWLVAQGNLTLSSDGETFQSSPDLSPIVPPDPPNLPAYQISFSLNVNLGTMTIHRTSGAGGIFADHLQLHYFNGVLYGTATHFSLIGPPPFSFEVLPGAVFTLTFQTFVLL